MEEDKAAAYYEELTRKGEGAARFKQGLGFSNSDNDNNYFVPNKSSSSFLSSFVKASSPTTADKQSQLQSVKNKLNNNNKTSLRASNYRDSDRNKDTDGDRRRSLSKDSERRRKRRSRSRSDSRGDGDRDRDRRCSRSREVERRRRRRSRSRSRSDSERDKDKVRNGDRNRHRSRSRDRERRHRRRSRSRSHSEGDRDKDRHRRRSGSQSDSEGERRGRRNRGRSRSVSPGKRKSDKKEKNRGLDYAKLIRGYDTMSAAERVKAKMKFQLSDTAEKDAINGMGSGWERFEFDKDAPLDDEEIEVADDDAALVKRIDQSFRFSTVEANREDQIKTAHDEAMFGSSRALPSIPTEHILEQENESKSMENAPAISLLSDKVIAGQRGSWRDRARKA